MSVDLLVGTDASIGGTGLHRLRLSNDGSLRRDEVLAVARNASFATYSPRHDLYYLVDEQADGALGAYRAGADGWQQVAQVATYGADPCYVALNGAEDRLAVANYGSGSIALFRLDSSSGRPLAPPQIRHHAGSGPVADRQEGPHAHCVCFAPDQRWLYHVDLGADAIMAYRADRRDGPLGTGQRAYDAPPGSGPRHLVFHPSHPLALLVSELANTLTVLAVGDGVLTPLRTRSTLPEDFTGESIAGHLSLDRHGERAYVTNRGHDSIAVFAWKSGTDLDMLQAIPSGGASPRAFALLEAERLLVLANEDGGNLTLFDLRPDGTLAARPAAIPLPGAVFPFVPGR
ncbi:lactonase family protein [Sphingomonas sp. S1-29]|uniref:lactonase family protein n=1 Tax=Sphingomonas sp. S1-29 TaxID=2991074 RepID=UPI00223F690E|nr:lactonase family protein [Sphingomonas sp. S1-29]UZK70279.1 lactonase family protein [Sphingomonas sp. S1-29]